jgi:hypothetical protein
MVTETCFGLCYLVSVYVLADYCMQNSLEAGIMPSQQHCANRKKKGVSLGLQQKKHRKKKNRKTGSSGPHSKPAVMTEHNAKRARSHRGQKVNVWKEENMTNALAEWKIQNEQLSGHPGGLTFRGLAKKWNVPYATLYKRTRKADLIGAHLSGHPTILSVTQEMELVELLKTMSRRGFPLTKQDVQHLAYQYAERNKISGFPKAGKAGKVWFKGFMRRHKDLRIRKPENLSSARAMGMNQIVVKAWFECYTEIVNRLGIAERPELFWNCDETGVQDQFDGGNAIGEVGKPCFRITPGERGETTTVLAAFNAAGEFADPMVIFKGKRIKSEWCVGSPPNTLIKCSDKGWITSELMVAWAEHFLAKIPDDDSPRILVLDGHITHTYNLKFLEMMKSRKFEVVCFPAHTTHWLQAADKSFFRSFKCQWNEYGKQFLRD